MNYTKGMRGGEGLRRTIRKEEGEEDEENEGEEQEGEIDDTAKVNIKQGNKHQ